MCVHAATVLPEDRLRHERRSKPEGPGYVFHHESEGGDVVGGLQRFRVTEINLMLAVSDLVMRRLDLKTHPLEHVDNGSASIFPEIGRRQIEVRPDIMRNRRWP